MTWRYVCRESQGIIIKKGKKFSSFDYRIHIFGWMSVKSSRNEKRGVQSLIWNYHPPEKWVLEIKREEFKSYYIEIKKII